MRGTAKQEFARKRNWALFQIKSTKSNLVRAMHQLGMSTAALEEELNFQEARIKEFYEIRCSKFENKD